MHISRQELRVSGLVALLAVTAVSACTSHASHEPASAAGAGGRIVSAVDAAVGGERDPAADSGRASDDLDAGSSVDSARPDATVRDAGLDAAVDELDSGPAKSETDGVYDCVSVFYRSDTCSLESLTVGQHFVLELNGSHAEAVGKFTCIPEQFIPPVSFEVLVGCKYSGLDAPNDACTLYIRRGDAATDIHLVFDSSGTQADCTMR